MGSFQVMKLPLLLSCIAGYSALQCLVCIPDLSRNRDCREASSAQLVTCPDTSTHCNALLYVMNERILVHRGCSGTVQSWGFGNSECDIMTHNALMDSAVSFTQCRGDGCNNVEPGDVSGVDGPKTLSADLRSQNVDGHSKAMISRSDEMERREGKQQGGDSDEEEQQSYSLLDTGDKMSTITVRRRTTTTTEAPTTTRRTTRTTTTTTTTPALRILTEAPATPRRTRPSRRNFTVFD